MKDISEKAVDRLAAYETEGLEQVILHLKNKQLPAGRYSDLVKVKPNQKTRREIFSGNSKDGDR